MFRRNSRLLVAAALFASSAWAANDPFVGKWKVDASKTKLNDEMKVELVGENKYTITFAPGVADTVVANGTDQPALQGTTFSIAVKAPNSWVVIRKQAGRTVITANWTLSDDGKTLNDAYTEYAPDGTPSSTPYVYERTAGSSGFTGTWDSDSEKVTPGELQIEPYEGDGLSFNGPGTGTKKVKFDGKDYPNAGPNAEKGSASSGRRAGERSLEITDKLNGKITWTRQFELSPDGKTLTMTANLAGENRPRSVFVFDRE
jgi:hypothetical protein